MDERQAMIDSPISMYLESTGVPRALHKSREYWRERERKRERENVSSIHLLVFTHNSYLSRLIIHLGDKDTVVLARGNGDEIFDRLGILVTRRRVPEDDTVLNLLWLAKGVDECVGEVAPLVAMTDVGKVDE